MAKNFALIGAAGFIAPRHLQAIKATGNRLVGAFDTSDSVGVLDSYFPECQFFTKTEQFVNFLERRGRAGEPVDFVTICSPNHMHLPHIQLALEAGAHVICEKPVALTTHEIEVLKRAELAYDRRVYTILQLRLHDEIAALKKRSEAAASRKHNVSLTYITSRGPWYMKSWKGDSLKSGGLSTNIGIHFFDMVSWIFGKVQSMGLTERTARHERGYLELERARVEWFLSIDRNHLPETALEKGKTTFRSIQIDGQEFEFSSGFTDLHTKVYQEIFDGNGCGLDDAAESVRIVEALRTYAQPKIAEVSP